MNDLKICVTTSNNYLHLIPVFCYLFNKNWSPEQKVEIVGYDRPDFSLPENFTFYSMGKQEGGANNFSGDLRKYFARQDAWFIWMVEDSFPTHVNLEELEILKTLMTVPKCGKINLTTATVIQDYEVFCELGGLEILENTQTSRYRLAMQPSIWRRDYLLKYLTPGMTPWQFEVQPAHNDSWRIFGADHAVAKITEGVTKRDIYKLSLYKVPPEDIKEMEELGILNSSMNY